MVYLSESGFDRFVNGLKIILDKKAKSTDLSETNNTLANVQTDLGNLAADVGKLKYVFLKLDAGKWSDTAPYTQTVSIPGMTEDWVPGVPSFIPFLNSDGSVNTTDTVIGLEHAACVKILISSSGTLTAVCPEEKPTWNFSLRVPGMVERS